MPPPSAWSSRSASAPPPDAAGRHRPARGGVSSPPRDSPEATTHPHVRGRPAFWGQSSIGEPQSIHGILSGTVRSSMAPTLLCHAPRCQRPPTERRSRRGPTERRPGLGRSRCPSGVIGHNVPHSVFRGEPGRFASRCTLCQRPAKRSRPAKPDEFRQRGFGSRGAYARWQWWRSPLRSGDRFRCVDGTGVADVVVRKDWTPGSFQRSS